MLHRQHLHHLHVYCIEGNICSHILFVPCFHFYHFFSNYNLFLNISVNGKPYKVTAFFPLYIWLNLSTSAISILDISTCNKFSEWIVSMKDKAFKYIYDKCGQNKPPKTTMNYTQLLVINRTIPSHVYLRSSHEQLSCTHSKQTLWMTVLLKEGILEPENCVTRRLN